MKGIVISILVVAAVAVLLFTNKPTGEKVRSDVNVQTDQISDPESKQIERNTDYQILTSDTNEFKNAVYLDVLIQEKLTLDEMIAIAHKERVSHGGTARVQVGFLYFSENNPYYGTAAYLVDCSNCHERDQDGEPISANIAYKESQNLETINNLPVGIDSSMVIARFYDHGWGNNALIAFTTKEKTKASYFHLYKNEEPGEVKLKPLTDIEYRVIDTGAKYRVYSDRVEYIQTNGRVSYTYQIAKQIATYKKPQQN
jgi:hypothetical protein